MCSVADLLTRPLYINLGENICSMSFLRVTLPREQKVDNVKVSAWMGVLAHDGSVFQLTQSHRGCRINV